MTDLHDLQPAQLRRLNALAQFGELALKSPSLDEILQQACALVREALGTDFAKIMMLCDDGRFLKVRSGVGWQPNVVDNVTVPIKKDVSEGYAFGSKYPVISTDVSLEKRFRYAPFLLDHGVQALVNVPILGVEGKSPFGIFEVDSKKPRNFTDRDIDLLRTYANFIAGAVERFRSLDEIRASERALRSSEEHFRVAVELNPQIIWTADAEGRVTSFDQRWLKLTGLSQEQALDQGWLQVCHHDHEQKIADAWAYSIRTKVPYDVSATLRKTGGDYGWFRMRAFAQLDSQGACLQWYGTIEDIEERVRLESALRDWNETLEERVAERTLALVKEQGEREATEEKLRQSQKMEAVGQLTGGLAHDFNNMLAGALGSLELMQLRLAQGKVDKLPSYIDLAKSTVQRAAALTHRLLAFSRQQTLEPKVIHPNKLVAGLEDLLRRTVGPGIDLETTLAANSAIRCDPNQLENAILNLAINARDAMPNGGSLSIRTGRTPAERPVVQGRDFAVNDYVTITVTDSGTGMTPEVMERAFDPFFTTKQSGEGTGLGLSMIYGFVQQSGGHTQISSEMGHGTSIALSFPLHSEVVDESSLMTSAVKALPRASGETVLLVDDEMVVRHVMIELLTDLGYTVPEAIDGRSALSRAEKLEHIDLLVTDIGLPGGLDGQQLAALLRVQHPQLKVLFITGFAKNLQIDENAKPATRVLAKPFSISDFSERIRLILGED
ncbi:MULTISPECIES: ATP-binding protein [unclassified Pseudomonas]|uniref:ATP-binding protein n=1 Tax=unclassified Pseudomonas TaxID=196821 RepID=UPI002AC8B7BB|nr:MULTISPECIES: ATP-binding protein [unclassified Pseudomonas]MEB0039899.1 ATP-binding protein [Pseudomonas sp. MH10]MEB0123539.1 ATP-binding protein [Pseudomonas sp. CCI1.2]WPX64635.1 ATP-binding protein [Pseudomonas sp. MH10]